MKPPHLTILPLTLDDVDALVALDNAVFEPEAREDREVYEDRLTLYPEGCFQLLYDKKLIGYIASEIWDAVHDMPLNRKASVYHNPKGRIVMVSAFGILPVFQNKGMGTFLFSRFMDIMRARGFHSVILRPASKAIPLYTRLGFKKIGQGEDHIERYDIMEAAL